MGRSDQRPKAPWHGGVLAGGTVVDWCCARLSFASAARQSRPSKSSRAAKKLLLCYIPRNRRFLRISTKNQAVLVPPRGESETSPRRLGQLLSGAWFDESYASRQHYENSIERTSTRIVAASDHDPHESIAMRNIIQERTMNKHNGRRTYRLACDRRPAFER
jgi:hypothetical protein